MKNTIHVISALSLPLTVLPSLLQAETSMELETNVITGIQEEEKSNQVTAYKTGTPLKDVPQSVTVVTAEEILEQGADSLADIVDYTPGVTNSMGEGHRDAIVFRGVRSTADFFVDGVRDDVQYYRPLYNVEQVEILRGPNALTFGRGGTGGVLNRVMKKPVIGETFNEFQLSVDSFGATSGQFDYNLGVSDNSAFRLNVFQEYLNNHRDFYEGWRTGINPTFSYELTPDTKLTFAYEYSHHDRFIDRGIPNDGMGGVAEELDGYTFGDEERNYNDLEAHTFNVTIDHQFSDEWKARLGAFYGRYDKTYSNLYSSDYDSAAQTVEIDGYIDSTKRQNFSFSGDLVGEFETGPVGHKVLFGGEFIHTQSDQNRYNNEWASNLDDQQDFDLGTTFSNGVAFAPDGSVVDTSAFSDLADDTEVELNILSFFLQDEIAVTDQLDVILGARFDRFDMEVKDNEDADGSGSQTDEFVTPRLGLVYKPIDSLSIYGSYSESYIPNSGEQYANLDDQLDPDRFSNLEFGLKYDLKDDLSFTASVFQIDQTLQSLEGGDLVIEEDAEVKGFELQLKGQITDQWYVSAGYSFLDGETASGTRPRELPENSLSIWNRYQVTEKFGLGLGMIYQDESFVDNNNTITLPSYVRFDAAAFYEFNDDFSIQLNVENLFDTDYYPSSHNNNNIAVGAPINAGITFVGRF